MDVGRLAIAIGLPWLLGIVWVRYRWERPSPGAWPMLAGYGFVAGILTTTLIMRLIDLLGFRQDFWSTCLLLLGLTGLGLWLGRDVPWRGWCETEDGVAEGAEPQRWERRAFPIVVAILAVRLVGLSLEMTSRPLFAWDAWATWTPKARVWWELKRLAPFVDWTGWVDQTPVVAYTLAGHHYPPRGYPFNRCKLSRWISLVLARTIRGPWASSRPGSGPMRTAWTTWSGCGGPPASPAWTAAMMGAGGWATVASCAQGAAAVRR